MMQFRKRLSAAGSSLARWVDSDYLPADAKAVDGEQVDWIRTFPFILLHVGCLGWIWVGWSWTALAVAAGLYFVRMFAVTGFYHRYFSHRTFRTSRVGQLIFAVWGAAAVQRGPLWWAGHHRHHHRHSDDDQDTHSPRKQGFWWAHMGWILSHRNFSTDYRLVKDLARYPELVWVNRFDWVVPVLLAAGLYGLGAGLQGAFPGLGTSGMQMLVWGFFISTTVLFHATASINSLAHVFGRKRFPTSDDSRNNFWLALITLGEGWHNNHHHYMHSTRQGMAWWEIDVTYYFLKMLSWTGLIWDLHPVPARITEAVRRGKAE